jgi:hypothetical protein
METVDNVKPKMYQLWFDKGRSRLLILDNGPFLQNWSCSKLRGGPFELRAEMLRFPFVNTRILCGCYK